MKAYQIECKEKTHGIVHYHLDWRDELFMQALTKGAALAGKVNIHDPSGTDRDTQTRVAKCTGGMLAEGIFQDFFNRRLNELKTRQPLLNRIELFEPPSDCSKGQIDFTVRDKVTKSTLLTGETRSSFSYKTSSIENVVCYAFSLLGPYISFNKPNESIKDMHVTIVHRVNPKNFLEQTRSTGIDSYIVGGGTRAMFLDKNTRELDNLYQRGAVYLIIKPIWKGLDAFQTVDDIFSSCGSKLK